MARSTSFEGHRLIRSSSAVGVEVFALMAASNDFMSAGQAYLTAARAEKRAKRRASVHHQTQLWALRMSVMHLWEVQAILRRETLLGALSQLPNRSYLDHALELRRVIQRHPVLRLRSNLSAHYKREKLAEGLALLEQRSEGWFIEAGDGRRGDYVFGGHGKVIVALIADKVSESGEHANDEDKLEALSESIRRMLALREPLDTLIWGLLAELRAGRLKDAK